MGTTNVAAGQPSSLKFDRLLTCMVKVEFVALLPISCLLQREIEIEISIRPCRMLHIKFTELYTTIQTVWIM